MACWMHAFQTAAGEWVRTSGNWSSMRELCGVSYKNRLMKSGVSLIPATELSECGNTSAVCVCVCVWVSEWVSEWLHTYHRPPRWCRSMGCYLHPSWPPAPPASGCSPGRLGPPARSWNPWGSAGHTGGWCSPFPPGVYGWEKQEVTIHCMCVCHLCELLLQQNYFPTAEIRLKSSAVKRLKYLNRD